jgi:hypothetical protein
VITMSRSYYFNGTFSMKKILFWENKDFV